MMAEQNLFEILQAFSGGARNWSQIVQRISCWNENLNL